MSGVTTGPVRRAPRPCSSRSQSVPWAWRRGKEGKRDRLEPQRHHLDLHRPYGEKPSWKEDPWRYWLRVCRFPFHDGWSHIHGEITSDLNCPGPTSVPRRAVPWRHSCRRKTSTVHLLRDGNWQHGRSSTVTLCCLWKCWVPTFLFLILSALSIFLVITAWNPSCGIKFKSHRLEKAVEKTRSSRSWVVGRWMGVWRAPSLPPAFLLCLSRQHPEEYKGPP